MNKLSISIAKKENNYVEAKFTVDGEWQSYFKQDVNSWIEYEKDIVNCPDSVLVVPFLGNILPLVWLCDAEVYVDSLDKTFFDNLENIKNGYKEMYPMFDWGGKVICSVQENLPEHSEYESSVFFSGGVDAWTTLVKHIDEKPLLLTIWGSDVKVNDEASWKNVNDSISKTSKDLTLPFQVIKSNFREVIDEGKLSTLVQKSNDGWWHGFQHGIALIAHAAPLAFYYGIKNLYIASSFPETMKGQYTCASDPIIDNYVNFCGCQTIHDGREFDRLGKVRYLMEQKEELTSKMNLRVCWQANSFGKNCCHCEKCYRTILELASVNCRGGYNSMGFLIGVSGKLRGVSGIS